MGVPDTDKSTLGTGKTTTPGEALKDTQSGKLPVGTVREILDAPTDTVEEILEVPEWKCSVKVRSFTAAQSARVKQHGFKSRPDGGVEIAWAAMEHLQFKEGVIEPQFSELEVRRLSLKSGPGWARIINWLDEHGKIDKEALERVQDEFPGSDKPDEV